MPRGGKRQGTPGKGYANRTDLTNTYDNQGQSAASGGVTAPPMAPQGPTPEDSPMLTDPTNNPNEPITAGLPVGAGPGPEALTGQDPRKNDTIALKKWLPLLDPIGNDPSTPDSFRMFLRVIRNS